LLRAELQVRLNVPALKLLQTQLTKYFGVQRHGKGKGKAFPLQA
jgi:hypothetical protein